MRPHEMPVQDPRQAAQIPIDPAKIARQVCENAQSYNATPASTIPFPLSYHPIAIQPQSSYFGGIGPTNPSPLTLDALGCSVKATKPDVVSSGINQNLCADTAHYYSHPHKPGPANSSNVGQLSPRPASINASPNWPKSPKISRNKRKRLSRSLRRAVEAGPKTHGSKDHDDPTLAEFGSLYFSWSPTPESKSTRKDVPSSKSEAQEAQHEASACVKPPECVFVHYGEKDPRLRSLRPRTSGDKANRTAVLEKGGACGCCRRISKRCDGSDHCQKCIDGKIPSKADFLASLWSPSCTPGLEDISLRSVQSSAFFNDSSLAEPNFATIVAPRSQATDHVDSWFESITKGMDMQPFWNDVLARKISLEITSGMSRQTKPRFNLDFLDISGHLEHTASLLELNCLVTGFLGHSSAPKPPAPSDGQFRSNRVSDLSWAVCQTFTFLRSFADADIYATITDMHIAPATIAIIYANLYRFLLTQSDNLCSFVLKSWQQDFKYCTRRTREDVIEDSIQALAQYYRVVTGLADLDLGCSSEAASLFSGLKDRARRLLRNGGLKDLLVEISTLIKSGPIFEDIISSSSSEIPDIRPLKIALRLSSNNNSTAPVPTEALRGNDPSNHHIPIKVRVLLKQSGDLDVNPGQVYINNFTSDFGFFQPRCLEQPLPSDSYPSALVGYELFAGLPYTVPPPLPTSLNLESGSTRPSQQDTELESIETESTIQNDNELDYSLYLNMSYMEESADHGWRKVSPGKRGRRRERSGDSQGSHHSSSRSDRKHSRLDSGGRASPPLNNYYSPLAGEAANLC